MSQGLSIAASSTSTSIEEVGASISDIGPNQVWRNSLKGIESIVFDLVCKESSSEQWASWLKMPIVIAAHARNNALVASLMRAGAPVGGALGKYIEYGSKDMVDFILNEIPDAYDDFTIRIGQGDSPIHFAAWVGQENILMSLL